MIALAIVCLILLGAGLYREHQHALHTRDREKSWDIERAALLNRIQRPDAILPVVPQRAPADEEIRDLEDDEIDLVGTIQVNGSNPE